MKPVALLLLLAVFKQTLEVAFLDRMAICFGLVVAVLTICTLVRSLAQPVVLPVSASMDLTPSRGAKVVGLGVCAATALLYIIFW